MPASVIEQGMVQAEQAWEKAPGEGVGKMTGES